MAVALAAALGIAAACTPDEEGDFGSPDTSLGTADVPSGALTRIAVTVTDENVIALLDTTYDALIELGGMASSRAHDPRVREIVSDALTRERQMRQENLALAQEINASPKLVETDPVEGHHEALEQLRMQSGEQFDRAYLERSIEMHEALLSEVRESLEMPGTIQVRDHLERVAATLETDLTRTRELLTVLRAGS
jgi:predicted outer membrane protein